MVMVRQGASNWRHYTFAQKANAIAKVKAHHAYHGPGCSVVEACWKCSINSIDFIKMEESSTMVKKQPLLSLIIGELLHFFEYHEQDMVVDNWWLSIKACQSSSEFKSLMAMAKVIVISHWVQWHSFPYHLKVMSWYHELASNFVLDAIQTVTGPNSHNDWILNMN